MIRIGSLFSGIGGLELGLERAGLGRTAWQVEIDPFCRGVLARHWPETKRYEDVRTVGRHNAEPVDVLCGGFPCQDVSLAGKRAGLEGERSGLWTEYRRIVEELAPSAVVVENVLGLRTSGLPRVLADLAGLGFDAEWSDLGAFEVGAPHVRRRLFVVATHPERVELRIEQGWLGRACRRAASLSLSSMAKVGLLPTPMASSSGGTFMRGNPKLSTMAKVGLLPTPTVKGNHNKAGLSARSGDGLATAIGGPLSARFVEWVMGFPLDHTAAD